MRVILGSDSMPSRRLSLRWLWEPRDLWVGVFWCHVDAFLLIYVAVLPCLPLCIAWRSRGSS